MIKTAAMSKISETFRWRQQGFTVTPKDTEYTVHYLGSMRTLMSRGETCCEHPMRRIWRNTSSGAQYIKAKLYLGTKGVRLVRADGDGSGESKEDREQVFHLHRITCCRVSQQIPYTFAWIYRHELPRLQVSLRVHVAKCVKLGIAPEISAEITRMYTTAFEQFKRELVISKRKSETQRRINIADRISVKSWSDQSDDEDADDCVDGSLAMSEALPPTPLRRIINARSSFKPPLAHRLSLNSKMVVIQERKDEDRIPGSAMMGLLTSPSDDQDDVEIFDDFKPAHHEL